jgi:hypothetical protein
MQLLPYLVVAFALFCAWLATEWFGGRATRIAIGPLCFLAVGSAVVYGGGRQQAVALSRYNALYRMALQDIQYRLADGDQELVRRALRAYDEEFWRTDRNPEAAAGKMLRVLRHADE